MGERVASRNTHSTHTTSDQLNNKSVFVGDHSSSDINLKTANM